MKKPPENHEAKEHQAARASAPVQGSRRHTTAEQEIAVKELRAFRVDFILLHLARGRAAIDVALGEILLRLGEGDRLDELQCSSKVDYAREKLGLPKRTYLELEELALGLRTRPILQKAVLAGEVPTTKARIVCKAEEGADETALTVAAMEMTVKELKDFVHHEEGEVPSYSSLRFSMTPEQQDKVDAAISLAKELEGYDAPEWKLNLRVAMEYLAHGDKEGEATVEEVKAIKEKRKEEKEARKAEREAAKEKDPLEEMTKKNDPVSKAVQAHLEALQLINGDPVTDNVLGLDSLAKRLVVRRNLFSEPLGRALFIMSAERLWHTLGFRSFEEYCEERLGISISTARERTRLERRMKLLPPLRKVLKSGRLTYTKVVEISRIATPSNVWELIREAESTTCQQTKEAADREEKKRDREKGERKLRGPARAMQAVAEAVEKYRQKFALEGEEVSRGTAWSEINRWFFLRYEKKVRQCDWRKKWEREVFLRYGGLCAVPGCTRAAVHKHHIVFQEDDGPDVPANCTALCWFHHKRCLHRGLLVLRGRGGEHLTWIFKARDDKSGDLVPVSEWETFGDNDVRRRGSRRRRGVTA